MRITCPSCHANYEVPQSLLDGGTRKVRCARCAFEWAPEAEMPGMGVAAPAPEQPPSRPRPEPRPERPPRTEPQRALSLAHAAREPPPSSRAHARPMPMLASVAVVVISVVVLVGLGWAAYNWRTEVMHLWPPSQRLFAALGLA